MIDVDNTYESVELGFSFYEQGEFDEKRCAWFDHEICYN